MKKSLISKILVICILVLGLSFSAFGCTTGGVSEAKAVLEAYERYAETETKLFKNHEFQIQFAPNIQTAISGKAYNANGELVSTPSHFEVLKLYNEIATKSTVLFVNWRNLLKTESDNITKKQANALYLKFNDFKSACKDLVQAVDDLNYWNDTILHNGNVNNSTILKTHLEILKARYGNVIQKSFAMTNQFLTIYDSLITTTDFVNDKQADLKTGDVELTADHFIVEVLDAAFELDGIQFALYQEGINNKHIYSETVNKVLAAITAYNNVSDVKLDIEDYSDTKKANVQNALRLYQINLESFKQQKEQFLKLSPEVDYAGYKEELKRMQADEEYRGKTTAQLHEIYLTNLADEEPSKVASFMFVHDFIRTDLINVVNSFTRLVNAVDVENK